MSDSPLYYQVYLDLLAKIESGEYSENAYLPAERVLCDEYHVSRSTIRRTLNDLEQEGYITRIHGNGNLIRPKKYDQSLSKAHSFAESLLLQGIQLENEILNYELITTDKYLSSLDTVKHDIPPNSRWHKLTRLRSACAHPLMIETSYMLQSRFLSIDVNVLQGHSLYAYLKKFYSVNITDTDEALSPLLSNANERMLLQIPPHVPCMLCERFCYEGEYLTVLHRTVVRGDKFKFKVSSYRAGNCSPENT